MAPDTFISITGRLGLKHEMRWQQSGNEPLFREPSNREVYCVSSSLFQLAFCGHNSVPLLRCCTHVIIIKCSQTMGQMSFSLCAWVCNCVHFLDMYGWNMLHLIWVTMCCAWAPHTSKEDCLLQWWFQTVCKRGLAQCEMDTSAIVYTLPFRIRCDCRLYSRYSALWRPTSNPGVARVRCVEPLVSVVRGFRRVKPERTSIATASLRSRVGGGRGR